MTHELDEQASHHHCMGRLPSRLMTDARNRRLECGVHGMAIATYVCQHIVSSVRTDRRVGFITAEDGLSTHPDAWCRACEAKRLDSGGEWNDESERFAGVKLLCSACYEEVKRRNVGPSCDSG